MMKKEILIALMVISIFLVSACEVYDTLYVKQPKAEGEVIEVPEEAITIDVDEDLEELEEPMEEEAIGEVAEEINIEDLLEEEVAEEEEVSSIDAVQIDIEDIFEEEEEIPEDATVTIVEETELVSLVPKAEDPDQDALTFTFTSPLNENGEWQTTYGDAGQYTITVTASDGSLTASKEVLIIVNRKEEAPVLESFKPDATAIEIDETDTITFDVVASDLNDDDLTYSWKLDGIEIGNTNSIEYQTTYEDSGSHTIKAIISDGMFETEKIWSVTVNNVNRKPLLEIIDDIEAKETDTIVIELQANDFDGDELSYAIDDERFVQDGNSFTWETTYDDAGEYVFTATVSDGVDITSQEFTVSIENVNRAPVILDIVQKQ
jgi:hypothetical protein